jgi:hypothetical protein
MERAKQLLGKTRLPIFEIAGRRLTEAEPLHCPISYSLGYGVRTLTASPPDVDRRCGASSVKIPNAGLPRLQRQANASSVLEVFRELEKRNGNTAAHV